MNPTKVAGPYTVTYEKLVDGTYQATAIPVDASSGYATAVGICSHDQLPPDIRTQFEQET